MAMAMAMATTAAVTSTIATSAIAATYDAIAAAPAIAIAVSAIASTAIAATYAAIAIAVSTSAPTTAAFAAAYDAIAIAPAITIIVSAIAIAPAIAATASATTSERDQLLVHRDIGPRVVEVRQSLGPIFPDLSHGRQFIPGLPHRSGLAVIEAQQPRVHMKRFEHHGGTEDGPPALRVPQAGCGLASGPVHARQDQQPHGSPQVCPVHPFPLLPPVCPCKLVMSRMIFSIPGVTNMQNTEAGSQALARAYPVGPCSGSRCGSGSGLCVV